MPGLIVSDIDGTLLRSDHTISSYTCEVIRQTQQNGWEFMLATGRPPRWLPEVTDQLNGIDHGVALCANGAAVIDVDSGDVVTFNGFDREPGLELIGRVRAVSGQFSFGVEWTNGFGREPLYVEGGRSSGSFTDSGTELHNDEDFFAHPVIKILVRTTPRNPEEVAAELTDVLDGLGVLTTSSPTVIEISAPGVSKGTTLARYAEDKGYTADQVIAFGDQLNDETMLGWVGRPIVMPNGHPKLHEQFSEQAVAPNDEDGVAQTLERILAE